MWSFWKLIFGSTHDRCENYIFVSTLNSDYIHLCEAAALLSHIFFANLVFLQCLNAAFTFKNLRVCLVSCRVEEGNWKRTKWKQMCSNSTVREDERAVWMHPPWKHWHPLSCLLTLRWRWGLAKQIWQISLIWCLLNNKWMVITCHRKTGRRCAERCNVFYQMTARMNLLFTWKLQYFTFICHI